MTLALLIAEMLFKSIQQPVPSVRVSIVNGVGAVLVFVGSIVGLCFLFQYFANLFGEIPTGFVFASLFILAGIIMLVIKPKQKIATKPIDEINKVIESTTGAIKNIPFDKILAENSVKILVGAFAAGFVLSKIFSFRNRG